MNTREGLPDPGWDATDRVWHTVGRQSPVQLSLRPSCYLGRKQTPEAKETVIENPAYR